MILYTKYDRMYRPIIVEKSCIDSRIIYSKRGIYCCVEEFDMSPGYIYSITVIVNGMAYIKSTRTFIFGGNLHDIIYYRFGLYFPDGEADEYENVADALKIIGNVVIIPRIDKIFIIKNVRIIHDGNDIYTIDCII